LCGAVSPNFGLDLAHHAASAEFNHVIFDFHAGYISRATSLPSDSQLMSVRWKAFGFL
jgi:hypothetical protein